MAKKYEHYKPLTPSQEARARTEAYTAFKKEVEAYSPPPQLNMNDLFYGSSRGVRSALIFVISSVPGVLIVILIAAMVISADKTFSVFGSTAAWGFSPVVGIAGLILVEFGIIYSAFAERANRLMTGRKRKLWNLKDFRRGFEVRLGRKPALSYEEVEDRPLESMSKWLMILAIGGNAFMVLLSALTRPDLFHTGNITALDAETQQIIRYATIGFSLMLGTIAPISLHLTGSQLADIAIRVFRDYFKRKVTELQTNWEKSFEERWTLVRHDRESAALHRSWVVANNLPQGADSPYLLVAGKVDGEAEAVPLVQSHNQLPTMFSTDLLAQDYSNGNGSK